MNKFFGAAMIVSATVGGVGAAQAQSFSANVALTSDYVFRGISLSGEDPVMQGGLDFEMGNFYAGAWGSGLGSAGTSMELDLYAGFTPQLGPVQLDLGVIGYLYPGADDDTAELDFYELALAGSIEATPQLTLGAGLNFSPENYGETGEAIWYEVNAAFALSERFAISGAFGNQSVDDVDGPLAGTADDDYNAWNLGATFALHGFELDLRYHEADIDAGDPIDLAGFAPEAIGEGRVVFTISRAL